VALAGTAALGSGPEAAAAAATDDAAVGSGSPAEEAARAGSLLQEQQIDNTGHADADAARHDAAQRAEQQCQEQPAEKADPNLASLGPDFAAELQAALALSMTKVDAASDADAAQASACDLPAGVNVASGPGAAERAQTQVVAVQDSSDAQQSAAYHTAPVRADADRSDEVLVLGEDGAATDAHSTLANAGSGLMDSYVLVGREEAEVPPEDGQLQSKQALDPPIPDLEHLQVRVDDPAAEEALDAAPTATAHPATAHADAPAAPALGAKSRGTQPEHLVAPEHAAVAEVDAVSAVCAKEAFVPSNDQAAENNDSLAPGAATADARALALHAAAGQGAGPDTPSAHVDTGAAVGPAPGSTAVTTAAAAADAAAVAVGGADAAGGSAALKSAAGFHTSEAAGAGSFGRCPTAEAVTEAYTIQAFLDATSSQLTEHGLVSLHQVCGCQDRNLSPHLRLCVGLPGLQSCPHCPAVFNTPVTRFPAIV
jgi:hypothetical protein